MAKGERPKPAVLRKKGKKGGGKDHMPSSITVGKKKERGGGEVEPST